MVPQPRAAISKTNRRIAPPRRRVQPQSRRWPLAWTVFSAIAASALLWAIIYFVVSGSVGLIGNLLSR